MKLLNWIDGSTNFATKTKPLYIEDDYKPRKSYYDNATTAKKSKDITNNSFLFYFNQFKKLNKIVLCWGLLNLFFSIKWSGPLIFCFYPIYGIE